MSEAESGCDERSLRIALFHANLPEPGRRPGGVEIAVHRLANALVDLGNDHVTVLSTTRAPLDARYASERIFAYAPALATNALARVLLLPLALNTVDLGRYDVVHLHGDDWFLFLRKTATVRTLHGSALREAAHSTSPRHKALMYGLYALEHLSARLCTLPLAVGNDAAALYGIRHVVSNGVDLNVFFPGKKASQPRVLFVGTWEGRKRGQFVYESFLRDVLPRFPEAELCMVSDVCGQHPSVIHEVFPSDSVLAQRYREAWVFALPSTYEGFGIPYLEALASGTAVVSTPNTGAQDVLDGGRYGDIVEDAEFGRAIADALGSREHRERLEQAGIDWARHYSWEQVARHHRAMYLSALSLRSRPDTTRPGVKSR